MLLSVVPLPAPVALAGLTDSLTPPGGKAWVYQPKWDGYRAVYSAGRLVSRNGTDLTPLFPDLTPVLAARLAPDLVLDGELVTWSPSAGRLDFAGLQARMTAGKRIRAVAGPRPAASRPPGHPRGGPVRAEVPGRAVPTDSGPRRGSGVAHDLDRRGIEGLVIKDADGTYPTRDGQRCWLSPASSTRTASRSPPGRRLCSARRRPGRSCRCCAALGRPSSAPDVAVGEAGEEGPDDLSALSDGPGLHAVAGSTRTSALGRQRHRRNAKRNSVACAASG